MARTSALSPHHQKVRGRELGNSDQIYDLRILEQTSVG
ncbi:unnamed protein product, partial [Allacma fusca]